MCFMALLHAFISSLYTNLIYSHYPIVVGEGWLRFLDLWSGEKPYWHGRLSRWRMWSACDVSEVKLEGLENELWCRWSNGMVGECGSAHSPTLLASLHLCQRNFNITWWASHACWNWYLTSMVSFIEVLRAQLAKSTLLTSTLVPLQSYQIF